MNGMYYILIFFFMVHFLVVIGLLLNKEKVRKVLVFVVHMVYELVFELGKTLLLAGVVGVYFIPETKDFTNAIYSGIIFFIFGYAFKYRKENR